MEGCKEGYKRSESEPECKESSKVQNLEVEDDDD